MKNRWILGSVLAAALMAGPLAISPCALAQIDTRPVSFVDLAERLSPAVVNISTSQNIEPNVEMPEFPDGSPLERYNDFFGNGEGRIASSLGSGFVISPDGFIATNNHVIEDADLIEVTFPDGDTYEAKLIGRDPKTDVAVLKIDAGKDLPFVEWGDSDDANVGEWVMAIGNPFGYSGTVTTGIVSARNRNIGNNVYDDFIQSDVAINKGNSGGPLFNMAGEVVGMNTAIVSPTGGSVGISFTTPSNLVRQVVGQLQEYGQTRRGTLGIRVQKLTRDIATAYKLDEANGALVKYVEEDSPADKAGLKVGDVILSYDGKTLEKASDIFLWVADSEIGKSVDLRYVRKGGKAKTAKVTVELLEEEDLRPDELDEPQSYAALGISAETLTDSLRRKYRVRPGVKGVIVTRVSPRSDASGKLRVGDVIEQVEYEDVTTVESFKTKVERAEEEGLPIILLINRGGYPVIYSVRAGA